MLEANRRATVPHARRSHDSERELDALPSGTSLETEVDAARALQRMSLLLATLTTRQREAVLLRVFEGLSTRETARAMGVRQGTVKALLHGGLARLRRSLASGREQ